MVKKQAFRFTKEAIFPNYILICKLVWTRTKNDKTEINNKIVWVPPQGEGSQ